MPYFIAFVVSLAVAGLTSGPRFPRPPAVLASAPELPAPAEVPS
jgi:hypothetical protein